MRLYKILILLFFFIISVVKNGISQDEPRDTDTTKYKLGMRIRPSFNSLQGDGCTFIVTSAAAVSATVSFINISTTKWENVRIGPRAGIEYYTIPPTEPKEWRVSYFDVNLLMQFQIQNSSAKFDIYGGTGFHAFETNKPSKFKNRFKCKVGTELKVKANKFIGFMFKVASNADHIYGGLGMYFGYGKFDY